MSMDSVKYHATAIVDALYASGHNERARNLENLLRDLDVPEKSEAALNELIGLCNIRALGDLFVESMSWQNWLNRLEKLARACRRELKRQSSGDREGSHVGARAPAFDHAGQLIGAATGLSAAALLFAIVMVLLRLPDFSLPETVDVSGQYSRSEVLGGGANARRLSQSSGALLFLKGDGVVYRVSGPSGAGWNAAKAKLEQSDLVTLLVDEEKYRQARALQEGIQEQMARERSVGAVGNLVARSIFEGKRDAVPVYEIRLDDEVIFSRRQVLPEQRRDIVFWSLFAAAALAMIAGLFLYDRRRRKFCVAADRRA